MAKSSLFMGFVFMLFLAHFVRHVFVFRPPHTSIVFYQLSFGRVQRNENFIPKIALCFYSASSDNLKTNEIFVFMVIALYFRAVYFRNFFYFLFVVASI